MSRKEELKELLTFSRGEKRGIFVLLIIIVLVIIVNLATDFKARNQNVDFSKFEQEIDSFQASLKAREGETYVNRLDKYIIERYDSLTLFKFNPNTTSDADWLKLGLTDKQISTIKNYLTKGGKFYDKDDFRKMYGIRTKQFDILKPYIDLPDKTNYASTDYEHFNKNYDYGKKPKKSDDMPDDFEVFPFNPNEISDSEWLKLGFTEKQTGTIRNYLNKGGKFRKPEDLQKIYGIKETQYERVKDYIQIPKTDDKKENSTPKTEESSERKMVDINTLSAEEFVALGGFWKYNGVKIAKFRNDIGGFHSKEQLLDVYGVKVEYYERVSDNIIVGKVELKQIRINFADEKELAAHPYLEIHNAKDIIEFRDKHGNFTNINILREKKILSQTTFDKLKPYLTAK